MTNEEAIARIKDHIDFHRYREKKAVKIFEALEMAIKALEQPDLTADQIHTMKEQEYCRGYEDGRKVERESWDEMLVMCDSCGHAIHVKREDVRQPEPCEDSVELDEAIRRCDEIVRDITWFCNSPSKYIEQRRHESTVKLRQLASWLKELKRLKSEKEKMIDALSEKMCYMNTCPNERDTILRIVGGTTNCENHCNTDCNHTNCESYRYGDRDERTD